VVYLAEFKFIQQFLSKLSEFMLKVCPTYTDRSTYMTMPLADSGINVQLVKLRPLID